MSRLADFSVLHPDVLVVGGGLAAITAALTVLEQGRSVAVVSLGPVGASGNTLVARAGIAVASGEPDNSAALFKDDLDRSGKELADPLLTARLADDSYSALQRLEAWGVPIERKNGELALYRVPGHSVSRNVNADFSSVPYAMCGITFMKNPAERLRAAGVPVINGLRAVKLALSQGRAAGVLAYDRKTGEARIIPAGSVILATGGYGRLFGRTNNVSDIYGDGAALALNAGATLRDMEMVQFYPSMMFTPVRLPLSNPLFPAGAVLRDRDGNRFMHRYDPAGDTATRDVMARAIFMEIQAGRGVDGCINVDCTAIPDSVLNDCFAYFCATLAKYGLDPRRDYLRGTPCVHYTLGGIRIDEWGRTDLPGLYAAGEVSGGVHGVNRLGGAALMEAAVFGRQAGLAAADETASAPGVLDEEPPESGKRDDFLREKLNGAMRVLRGILWDKVSLVRDASGLQAALEDIAALRRDLADAMSLEEQAFAGSLLVAKAVTASALAREESRGAHFREDFPATDPSQTWPVLCRMENGALQIFRR